MDWEECCNKRIAKEVSHDENVVSALTKSSKNKLESESKLTIR